MQAKKQQLELDMGLVPTGSNWTGSKLRKDYVKAVYCRSAYLTSMEEEKGMREGKMFGWHHGLDGCESE